LNTRKIEQVKHVIDACKVIRRNDPPVCWLTIKLHLSFDERQYADIIVTTSSGEKTSKLEFKSNDEYDNLQTGDHMIIWKVLGLCVANNTSLHELHIEFDIANFEAPGIGPVAAICLSQVYNGIKLCQSINSLFLDICPLQDAPMFDLNCFMKNSMGMVTLKLYCSASMPHHQSATVAYALENNSLYEIELYLDDEDGSTERILTACFNVTYLEINRPHNSYISSIATLLKNQDSTLAGLSIYESSIGNDDLSWLAQSLAENKVLRCLEIQCQPEVERDHFNTLLCDASSINDIKKSNHTFSRLSLTSNADGAALPLPQFAQDNLKLNGNANKDKVIHEKIMMYYFQGKFDVTPFVNMPLSAVPQVMSPVKGSNLSRQVAISRLLGSIPELYSVSNRDTQAAASSTTRLRRSSRLKCKRSY
jgi:hypothetical protein